MNKYFIIAEDLIKKSQRELAFYTDVGKDPIECYNPSTLDLVIQLLICARTQIALGRYVDDTSITVLPIEE